MDDASGTRRLPHGVLGPLRSVSLLLLLSFASILINGYHLGHQDQAVWLVAIKNCLDPGLYPLDSAFFLAQTQYTLFPQIIAGSVKATRLPLDWAVFLWHLLSILLFLLASLQIARRVFATRGGQWGALAAIWAARLMVAAGSKVSLTGRYLHPRDLATVAVLFALVAVLDGRVRALAWIALAAILHPTMAVIGAFHLVIQAGGMPRRVAAAFAAAPLAFLAVGPVPNPVWRQVAASRSYLFPLRWHWYEWVGVAVPLGMLLWYARVGERSGLPRVAHISRRAALAGTLGTAGALAISTLPPLERFIPTEPMRILHLVYYFTILLGGGLLGEYVLCKRPWRWAAFFAPILGAFYLANALNYRASPQVEWPGRVPANDWVRAFQWARQNTPHGALFALNPSYMGLAGNDSHGFRAFAERSALADGVKDRAVTANCPELAYIWKQETDGLAGWQTFGRADFERLKGNYRVNWVVLERSSRAGNSPQTAEEAGLSCRYWNPAAMVCEIGIAHQP